jgi:hypothetical protein
LTANELGHLARAHGLPRYPEEIQERREIPLVRGGLLVTEQEGARRGWPYSGSAVVGAACRMLSIVHLQVLRGSADLCDRNPELRTALGLLRNDQRAHCATRGNGVEHRGQGPHSGGKPGTRRVGNPAEVLSL